jgi:hypothetical protein
LTDHTISILGGDPAHADVYIIEVCHSWFDAFTLPPGGTRQHSNRVCRPRVGRFVSRRYHSYFSVLTKTDTPILSLTARLVLTGSELLPATRVAQTVLYAATDPDPATSGCSWLLPDNGPILRLERENIREGTYGVINDRIARFKTCVF